MASAPVTSVTLAPEVVISILDHYSRRDDNHEGTFGCLLGSVYGTHLEVRLTIPVHHSEVRDNDSVRFVLDLQDKFHQLYSQSHRKAQVVGWYSTHTKHDCLHKGVTDTLYTPDKYSQPFLLHLVVDPTTVSSEEGSISVIPITYADPTATPLVPTVVPLSYALSDIDRIATVALASSLNPQLIASSPALLSTADPTFTRDKAVAPPLTSSVQSLLGSLDQIIEVVDAVCEGSERADPRVARAVFSALAALPACTDELVEGPINDAVQVRNAHRAAPCALCLRASICARYMLSAACCNAVLYVPIPPTSVAPRCPFRGQACPDSRLYCRGCVQGRYHLCLKSFMPGAGYLLSGNVVNCVTFSLRQLQPICLSINMFAPHRLLSLQNVFFISCFQPFKINGFLRR